SSPPSNTVTSTTNIVNESNDDPSNDAPNEPTEDKPKRQAKLRKLAVKNYVQKKKNNNNGSGSVEFL
ncbi:6665_t:CDS:1, partial [Paraglomus occultum]